MTKRIAIVMLVLFGTVLMLIWLCAPTNREPKYKGRPLSQWFKQYYRADVPPMDFSKRRQAVRALRVMGTNAVPWLVTQCFTTNEDSSVKTTVLRPLGQLPFFPPFVPAYEVRHSAAAAIDKIKPPAKLLLPLATNAFSSFKKNQRWMAIHLLGSIGDGAEAAVPFLRERLRSGDPMQCLAASEALAKFGPDAKAAVPDLIELVKDVSGRRRHSAVYDALGEIGAAAAPAVPILQERLATETNMWTRTDIVLALGRIDPHEYEALDWFIGQMKDKDMQKRNEREDMLNMLRILGEIGPNAKVAVPFLRELLSDARPKIWKAAADALVKIGETNVALSDAVEKLKDSNSNYRVTLFILSVQPTNALALSNYVQLTQHPVWGDYAVCEVSFLRSAAQPVIPVLRAIATSKTNRLRHAAQRTLESIEAFVADERDARQRRGQSDPSSL